jgi:nucleoside-diphosphate-sugar epimerase
VDVLVVSVVKLKFRFSLNGSFFRLSLNGDKFDKGQPIVILGDGGQTRDFVYVKVRA